MTSQGSPGTRFKRAIDRNNIFLAELAAREMPFVNLEDALALAGLYAAEGSGKYDKAATRLLARLALERPVQLSELVVAAAALADLPNDPTRAEIVLRLVKRRPT